MKKLIVITREGKALTSPIKSQFNVLNVPQNFDELAGLVADCADKKSTVYSLFMNSFQNFSKTKVANEATVEFLDVLEITRKVVNSDVIRKQILSNIMADTDLFTSGNIDAVVFGERMAKHKTDQVALDVADTEHDKVLAERREKREKEAAKKK